MDFGNKERSLIVSWWLIATRGQRLELRYTFNNTGLIGGYENIINITYLSRKLSSISVSSSLIRMKHWSKEMDFSVLSRKSLRYPWVERKTQGLEPIFSGRTLYGNSLERIELNPCGPSDLITLSISEGPQKRLLEVLDFTECVKSEVSI